MSVLLLHNDPCSLIFTQRQPRPSKHDNQRLSQRGGLGDLNLCARREAHLLQPVTSIFGAGQRLNMMPDPMQDFRQIL